MWTLYTQAIRGGSLELLADVDAKDDQGMVCADRVVVATREDHPYDRAYLDEVLRTHDAIQEQYLTLAHPASTTSPKRLILPCLKQMLETL